MKGLTFLVFVFLTILCWGVYGPVLHEGQAGMGVPGRPSSLRPLICVGIAYFLIAVLYPVVVLAAHGEQGKWSIRGFAWSFIAGALGALGALGIILAFKSGGRPVYVMPLVFGFAPVVNTVVTMLMSRTLKEASPLFYAGVLIVAIGGAGVLVFKPEPASRGSGRLEDGGTPPTTPVAWVRQEPAGDPEPESAAPQDPAPSVPETEPGNPDQEAAADQPGNEKSQGGPDSPSPSADAIKRADGNPASPAPARSIPMIICSIALTAFCWGAYGPVLHRGQSMMSGSRLRPFLCVGLAYFALAVIIPVLLQDRFPEPGGWSNAGMWWSLLGGAAGALGALGIIYAFNFGGRPIFVMPLVFGGAPVVNTLTETISHGGEVRIPPAFYLSLALVILGAIIVLTCAPRPQPKPGAAAH